MDQHETALTQHQPWIDSLTRNITLLMEFLTFEKKQLRKKADFVYHRPWYLLIGGPQSGKSSLLHHAEFDNPLEIQKDDPYCSTVLTNNAVYIELSSHIFSEGDMLARGKRIVQELRKVRKKCPFNGILLTINIAKFCKQSPLQTQIQLYECSQWLTALDQTPSKKTPLYLIFTNLDLIKGFPLFFEEIDKTTREKTFGFMIPAQKSANTEQYITQKFQQLILSLQNAQIKRLRQVGNNIRRCRGYEFLLQLDEIQTVIKTLAQNLISHLENTPDYLLRGLFLSSSLQNGEQIDYLANKFERAFALSSNNTLSTKLSDLAYFTNQLLKETIPEDYSFSQVKSRIKLSPKMMISTALATSSFLCIAATGLFAKGFLIQAHAINTSNHALVEFDARRGTAKNTHNIPKVLSSLNGLRVASQELDNIHPFWRNIFLFSPINNVQDENKTIYKKELTTKLLPELANYIEQQILKLHQNEPEKKYAALKAYLMLAYPHHMNQSYFLGWLQNAWLHDRHYSRKDTQQVITNLNNLFSSRLPAVDINFDTITDARASLKMLPKSFLAFMALKNDLAVHEDISLKPYSEFFSFEKHQHNIPYMYTKAGFVDIVRQQLPKLSLKLEQSDWVLGKETNTKNSKRLFKKELINLYLSDYMIWWKEFLRNMKVQQIVSIADASIVLKDLSNTHASFYKIMSLINENTSALSGNDEAARLFNLKVASLFRGFSQVSPEQYNALAILFKQFHQDVKQLHMSPSPQEKAFLLSKNYFQHASDAVPNAIIQQSRQLPAPLSTWVQQINTQSLKLIFKQSFSHINHQWRTIIYPQFVSNIAHHYPFDKSSSANVSIADFTQFFRHRGTMDQFFQDYLAPFINTEQTKWKNKSFADLRMPFSKQISEQIIRARLINKMYFRNGKLKVRFALQPIEISSQIKDILIELEQQKLFSYPGSSRLGYFKWPHGSNHSASILQQGPKGLSKKIEVEGPWALFRILDQATITEKNNTKHFNVTFNIAGQKNHYHLIADDVVNPFIHGIIEYFDLPEQIA